MKRLVAILFLSILLFNLYGYRLVISGLQQENASALEKKVDKKAYSDDELISVKTTLHLPYYTGSADYERAYGSITIDGNEYEYVKRRVHNDTLEVLCLPNDAKTKLKAAGNDMAKAAADGQASAPVKKTGTTLKISLPDFCQLVSATQVNVIALAKQIHSLSDATILPDSPTSQLERPPQSMRIIS